MPAGNAFNAPQNPQVRKQREILEKTEASLLTVYGKPGLRLLPSDRVLCPTDVDAIV